MHPKQVVPFNCVDKALLALESGKERMVFHFILAVRGAIDPVRLNDAVLSAMRRHPTVRSLVRRRWLCYHREVQAVPQDGVVTVHSADTLLTTSGTVQTGVDTRYEEQLLQWLNQPLDVSQHLPLRVLLLTRERADHLLVFTFHHHVGDGLRCLNFVKEALDICNSGDNAQLLPVEDTPSLHKRTEVLHLIKGSRSAPRHLYRQVLLSLFHRFLIAPLSPPVRVFHDRTQPPTPEVRFLSQKIAPPELERIACRARDSGATLNDLLVAACFRAVEKWNAQHGKQCRKISIMVPVDMGRLGPSHLISNQVSYVSPATTPRDRANPAALLAKTREATASLIRNGGAASMVYFTYLLSFIPLALLRTVGRLLLITQVCVDSILVTNLGSIWTAPANRAARGAKLGDAIVEDVTIVTPVITPFRMAIAAASYDRAMSISLSYRACLVSAEKAAAFLALYMQEIRGYNAGCGSSRTIAQTEAMS